MHKETRLKIFFIFYILFLNSWYTIHKSYKSQNFKPCLSHPNCLWLFFLFYPCIFRYAHYIYTLLCINSSIAAEVVCEELQKDLCSFSIASSGKLCLLETEKAVGGDVEYQCRSSEVVVERMAGYMCECL